MKKFILISMLISSVAIAQEVQKEPEELRNWYFGAALAINNNITFDDYKYTDSDGTYNISGEFNYKNGFALIAENKIVKSNDWGNSFGIILESVKEFSDGQLSYANETALLTSDSPSKLSFLVLDANLIYSLDKVYFPFGLNYSIVNFKKSPASSSNVKASGGFGVQIGAGVFLNEKYSTEISLKGYKINLKSHTSDTKSELDDYYNTIHLSLKYKI